MTAIEPEAGWERAPTHRPSDYVCPVCESDYVADVTTPVDPLPVGLCANGHLALLRSAAEVH